MRVPCQQGMDLALHERHTMSDTEQANADAVGTGKTCAAACERDRPTFQDLACVWALKHTFAQDRIYISDIERAFSAAGKRTLFAASEFWALAAFDGVPMRDIGRDMQERLVNECLAILGLNYDYYRVILPPVRHPWWAFWRK